MSELHIRHIRVALQNKFDGLIALDDYADHAETDRHAAFLSRALAAYGLMMFSPIDAKTSASYVVDGGDDNGIDALYVDPIDSTVSIVQSKWSDSGRTGLTSDQVNKVLRGFDDLLNAKFDRFNPRVNQHQDALLKALDDPKTRFRLIFISTSVQPPDRRQIETIDNFLEQVNDTSELASYRVIRQAEVHRFVANEGRREPITLEVGLHQWGRIDDPLQAYYGQIDASEVARWYEEYGPRLLDLNLRKVLDRSAVNAAITETLLQEPENFWYFNNGVTALADSIQKKPLGGENRQSGYFVCQGVSIVNGAQTVAAITQASRVNTDTFQRARVFIRFISLEQCPDGFATRVARATNTQNRIERQDFAALDKEQERIRIEMQLDGRIYVVKRGERDPDPDKGCTLTHATIALACAHPDLSLAVQAKRELGKLWEDIDRQPYRLLFNDELTGDQVWRRVEVMREVDKVIRGLEFAASGRNRLIAVHGNRFILHHVFRLCMIKNGPIDRQELSKLGASAKEFTAKVVEIVTRAVESVFPGSYPASLFKNVTKCKRLSESVVPTLENLRSDATLFDDIPLSSA
ncbi:MAG: AIPR family protein [Phycisphaerae bacterium]|nr:AIPR family protein [Phycisphaerae bacterium]